MPLTYRSFRYLGHTAVEFFDPEAKRMLGQTDFLMKGVHFTDGRVVKHPRIDGAAAIVMHMPRERIAEVMEKAGYANADADAVAETASGDAT